MLIKLNLPSLRMKTPICSICRNSDMLCSACKKKVDEGKITAHDIRISRDIWDLSRKVKSIRDIEIKKILDCFDDVIIITRKGHSAKIVGKDGIVVKELAKKLQKNIRAIDEHSDMQELIENLLYPVPVLGTNVLYSPEGEFLKIIVPKNARLPLTEQSFKDALRLVYKQDVRLVFE